MPTLEALCKRLEDAIKSEFAQSLSGVTAREDSRAFGAMIENQITTNWPKICKSMNVSVLPIPGRRTIYDCAFADGGKVYGLDVKTKDLDSSKYSDGGMCAVANLLKFMVNDDGVFLIVEVGHKLSNETDGSRDISHIYVAPFSCLPPDAYRIENLGTGQVRLNSSLTEMYGRIDWNRTNKEFFEIFSGYAISHYEKVAEVALKRGASIERFKISDYKHLRFGK